MLRHRSTLVGNRPVQRVRLRHSPILPQTSIKLNTLPLIRTTYQSIRMSSTESNNSPKLTPQIPSGEDVKPKPQQQPRKQKSKGSSNKNRDLLSVYNEKFPDGTIGYVSHLI